MRVGLIALWLRAAIEDPTSRGTALRYAAGIAGLEVAWVLRLVLAEAGALAAGLAVPDLRQPRRRSSSRCRCGRSAKRRTSWHPHHIAERYGLFAIILLGEVHPRRVVQGRGRDRRRRESAPALVTIAIAGLVVIFALWWLYFLEPAGEGLARNPDRAFLWGCFGQYGVFAALAGLGAGLEVAIEQTGQSDPVVAHRRELRGRDSGRRVPRVAVGGLGAIVGSFGRSDPSWCSPAPPSSCSCRSAAARHRCAPARWR